MTVAHVKACITLYINLQPISAPWPSALVLTLESPIEMGCDTDFPMYYSLSMYTNHIINIVSR